MQNISCRVLNLYSSPDIVSCYAYRRFWNKLNLAISHLVVLVAAVEAGPKSTLIESTYHQCCSNSDLPGFINYIKIHDIVFKIEVHDLKNIWLIISSRPHDHILSPLVGSLVTLRKYVTVLFSFETKK